MPPFRLFSLPNLITCANLLTGCVGIWLAMRGDSVTACYLVGLAAALDFADGLVARALKMYSPVGKELDSLADMVSFGLLPAVLMAQLLAATPTAANAPWLPLTGFLLAVFAALRLAKFNVDTRQTTSFMGVPTPAATLFVAALPLVLAAPTSGIGNGLLAPLLRTAPALLALTALLCWLMISEIPLFALKFTSLRPEPLNLLRYGFVLAAAALVLLLGWAGVPVAILLYIGLSLLPVARHH
ncbi:MAG: CDP-alcohol phosphatidyltransferase family protein [Hymenobacteraceae bacterium]|nr:CDP-alcohol phosphatidyltransferase family protein [Hymenobacteraceae bacterium]